MKGNLSVFLFKVFIAFLIEVQLIFELVHGRKFSGEQ